MPAIGNKNSSLLSQTEASAIGWDPVNEQGGAALLPTVPTLQDLSGRRSPPQLPSTLHIFRSYHTARNHIFTHTHTHTNIDTHTYTHIDTHTMSLGGLDQAGQFDHLAPRPAPRCLWTPSSVRPFSAPLANPSSSFLCSGVSPPSLPLSSLSPPPACCLPPLFPPASFLLLLFRVFSWWAPRWR